jgi:hypothetical protein
MQPYTGRRAPASYLHLIKKLFVRHVTWRKDNTELNSLSDWNILPIVRTESIKVLSCGRGQA